MRRIIAIISVAAIIFFLASCDGVSPNDLEYAVQDAYEAGFSDGIEETEEYYHHWLDDMGLLLIVDEKDVIMSPLMALAYQEIMDDRYIPLMSDEVFSTAWKMFLRYRRFEIMDYLVEETGMLRGQAQKACAIMDKYYNNEDYITIPLYEYWELTGE